MYLVPEVTSKSYCVQIPTDKFIRLIEKEKADVDYSIDFMNKLEKLGASRIEYNGHFGANIFFDLHVEDEDKLPSVIELIEDEIE
jgi:hypothetical protein